VVVKKSGDMEPETHAAATIYHASVVSLLSMLYPGAFVVLIAWTALEQGTRFDVAEIGFGLVGCLPGACVVSWIFSKCFPVILSKNGIQGYSFWGLPRFIRWQDIKEARGFKLLHLKFLRLYSMRDQKVTWIALFQANPQGFLLQIQTLAPLDSPLQSFVVR